jgi:precorrin-6Y C5,15-methyltransferase (decarboxylating)
MNPINIIGMGQGTQDLTSKHKKIIQNADLLVGGRRHLELFPSHKGESLVITKAIEPLMNRIKHEMKDKKVVVLASGDPMFYGIGSTIVRFIDIKHLRIHSNVSSVSAAFAAIGEPWHDARIISLHGKVGQDFVFTSLAKDSKVFFLTDISMNPGYIASMLINEKLVGFKICVLENLGPEEKISWFDDYKAILDQKFIHPNVVILLKNHIPESCVPEADVAAETHIGMDDILFRHSKGLITKSEIRSISISKLKLNKKDHILWDIGSGSGSVGIEASALIPLGQVFSIEKNQERIFDIIHNIKIFNRPNIKALNLDFSKGSELLHDPDRVFIGGGGSNLEQIIRTCCLRLKDQGIIVVNTILLQNMETSLRILNKLGFCPELVQIQVSRSKPMPYGDRLEALNPVWIISGRKPLTKVEPQ